MGVAYQRRTGFRPISVMAYDNTFLLIPIHGSGCITSEGRGGAGEHACFVAAAEDLLLVRPAQQDRKRA
jgi:hypothetical protein